MPFIGELWPDSAYATDWSYNAISTTAWGNLRNSHASPIAGSWQRDAWQNCDVTTSPANGTNFVFSQVEHINGPPGCASFPGRQRRRHPRQHLQPLWRGQHHRQPAL